MAPSNRAKTQGPSWLAHGGRARILSVGDKLRHLPAKDHVKVMTELRAALNEAAEGED